jgi:hypothetical protein
MRFKTTIQGTIHDLGVEEHYFSLRERKSGRLIRCDFSPKQYERVHEVAKKPNALIYVRGIVQQRRVDRFIESMKVELLKEAPTAPNVFTSLFGQYPDFTGALSTVEFVDQQWGTEN